MSMVDMDIDVPSDLNATSEQICHRENRDWKGAMLP